jgi:predicted Ser/Thr protein kinase
MIIPRRRESTPDAAAGLRRGDTIAGYRIEHLLGKGGMGAVYEATQLSLGRSVALKVIARGVPIDATARERFRREGRLQAVLDHPHILPVYEAGESHGQLFIAMRLVHGPTLKTLAAGRALDPERSMNILGDVAHALDAAHGAALVHRDVKPQNILLDPRDFAYLADFGLSKAPGDATLTHTGQLLGSVAYMSPEQARGENATEASDIYSFTCVLYECLVGRVPFPRDSDHAVLHAHIWDPPPRPSEIRPELPRATDAVIEHGLAKAPGSRSLSACAVVREARSALGLEPDATDDNAAAYVISLAGSSTELDSPVASRRPRPVARLLQPLVALLVLLAAVSAGYLATREPGHAAPLPSAHNAGARPPALAAADGRFARDLNAAFDTLGAKTPPLDSKLRHARTPRSQAAALAGLSSAFGTAANAVERAHARAAARRAQRSVAAALTLVATGYRKLEVAAERRARHTYDNATRALQRRAAELADALRNLQKLGYRLV